MGREKAAWKKKKVAKKSFQQGVWYNIESISDMTVPYLAYITKTEIPNLQKNLLMPSMALPPRKKDGREREAQNLMREAEEHIHIC